MSEPFYADGIVYLRPNRFFAVMSFGLVLGPLLALVAQSTPVAVAPLLLLASPLSFVVGLLSMVWGRIANRYPGRITGRLVAAGAGGVFLDGERLATRGQIKSGLVVPRGLDLPMVRLDRGLLRAPLDLVVHDAAEGRALLRSLGLDASQTTATFRTPSRVLTDARYRATFVVGTVLFAFLGGFLNRHHGSPTDALVRLGIIAAILAFSILSRGRIDVGADGILWSWIGVNKRFVPYREITSVRSYVDTEGTSRHRYRGLTFTTVDGDTIRMPVAQATAIDGANKVRALVERVEEAMASYQRGDAVASMALLDRGDRSPAEWIRTLRTVGSGAAVDHRTAPLLPEQLWRIVEDPSQEPELRAGAAVVLGGSLDDAGRARLRVAAGAVAEPRVRVAIEAAGGDDEEALAEALAELPREARR